MGSLAEWWGQRKVSEPEDRTIETTQLEWQKESTLKKKNE